MLGVREVMTGAFNSLWRHISTPTKLGLVIIFKAQLAKLLSPQILKLKSVEG